MIKGIRVALVDRNGLVTDYFLASPENDALSGKLDADGNVCVRHDDAFPGDKIINGVWQQASENTPEARAAEANRLRPK